MTTTTDTAQPAGNPVLRVPAASPEVAVAHFAARLAVEADVADVHAALHLADPGLVLVDTRSAAAWEQGHVPGAVHLPTAEMAARARAELPADRLVVTHCWGPGCNGATRGALELARLGFAVKEMIGGYEYWVREGFETVDAHGVRAHAADPLTAPAGGAACGC